ncbi:MAG: 3'-5' exonuclease [Bacteroidales bacterium]|nr:3'-5' exonuclease [Bacteroidales bacterium]MBN2764334.1 3'-5' exonuclease [Bacteroidales bacterium]
MSTIKFENILFLDIETVPQYSSPKELPEPYKKLWGKKSSYFRKEDETADDLYWRAGIYAEFGKIICISTGMLGFRNQTPCFRVISFSGDHEENILTDFKTLLNKVAHRRSVSLCAHNGREFDFPYIARRMLVNGIELPEILDVWGKRPWEIHHLDTMDLWKFGDHKHYTSLELLAALFNIPSPKTDLEGYQVAEVYYKEKDLHRIVEYCQRDVITIAQLVRRFMGDPLLLEENIEIVKQQDEE